MSKTLSQVILESWIKGKYENELKELQSEFIKAIDNEIESLEKRIVRKLEFDHKKEEIDELVSKIKELKELRRNAEYDLLMMTQADIWSVYSGDLTNTYNKFREQLKNETTVGEFKGGFINGGLHNTDNLGVLKQKEIILSNKDVEKLSKMDLQTVINLSVNVDKLDDKRYIDTLTNTLMESLKKMGK